MTRTIVLCDACGQEIPAAAPRFRLESRNASPVVAADLCSAQCVAVAAGVAAKDTPKGK